MKSTFFRAGAIIALIAATLAGCKKKDDGAPTLVGDWEGRSFHTKTTSTVTNPPTVIYSMDTTYAAGQGNFISFRSNNTYVSRDKYSSPTTTDSGTYTLNGSQLIVVSRFGSSSMPDTANITLNANDFTISASEINGTIHDEFTFSFSRR